MSERMKKTACGLMIFAACLVFPGLVCADTSQEVLVTVGQETITRADLASKTATMPPQIRGRFETKAGRQQLLEQVVLISLLSQEARRLGIDKQEKVEKKNKGNDR
jgi:hypothetical protein